MASRLFLPRALLRTARRQVPRQTTSLQSSSTPSIPENGRSQRRAFSATPANRIMELSCFSSEQLMVRDAISKICANFPDVRPHPLLPTLFVCSWGNSERRADRLSLFRRNTGLHATSPVSIRTNYTLHWRKMDGLGLRCPRTWAGLGWGFRRLP